MGDVGCEWWACHAREGDAVTGGGYVFRAGEPAWEMRLGPDVDGADCVVVGVDRENGVITVQPVCWAATPTGSGSSDGGHNG